MKTVMLAAAGLLFAATGAQAQTTIYSQNFTFTIGGMYNGFTGGTAAVTPNGERYLELYQNNSATLSVNTSGYTGLNASFNLYGLRSVDGNGQFGGGADNFLVYLNGASTPLYTINVANYAGNDQNFNGNLAQIGGPYAARTGAIANDTLGYSPSDFGDSTYLISFALPDAPLTSIRFVGATTEDPVDPTGANSGNEAYGIDNVKVTGTAVTVTPAVPEPATWGMMILGLMGIGTLLRRREGVRLPA